VAAYAHHRTAARRATGAWSAAGAGLLSGAMGAASGINGPPLVADLERSGASPMQMRDTLATVFLFSGVLTAAALALTGALRLQPIVLVLLAAAALGQTLGRITFHRIGERRGVLVAAVLVLSALLATLPVIQAAGA
jgi:uncharacterized membrane protein YfcA